VTSERCFVGATDAKFFTLHHLPLYGFVMTEFHTKLSSCTPSQLNLAFTEIVSSLLWVQHASVQIVQILPSFLSLDSSSYLPPLHDENRQIIVDLGLKLAAIDRAYKFTNAGNEDSGYGICFIRDNILKRTVSLVSTDSVHSWLAPKMHPCSSLNWRPSLRMMTASKSSFVMLHFGGPF